MIAYPLTLRGTLILLAGIYLFLVPAKESADLVAALLGISIVVFGLIFPLITLTLGASLKKKLTPIISGPDEAIVARTPAKVAIRIGATSLPPLFRAKMRLKFVNLEVSTATHDIVGVASKERLFIEELTFPNRGNYQICEIEIRVGDSFGLSQIRWRLPFSDHTIRVQPGGTNIKDIPIVSSTLRSGDEIEHPTERTGDPFDLKPYHPSDGIRKILWKVFAKGGQLITRHPEKSMTPEGKIFLFVLAGRADDSTCLMALNHISKLEELQLETWTGCSGARDQSIPIARGLSEASELLIDTVWSNAWDTQGFSLSRIKEDLAYLLTSGSVDNSSISSLLIFISKRSMDSAERINSVRELGSWLSSQGINPVFCIDEHSSVRSKDNTRAPAVSRLFFGAGNAEPNLKALENYPNFLRICAETGWQVIL